MKQKKKLWIIPLILLLIAAAALGWVLMNYHVVGLHLYPKNAAALDLRGQEISIADFDTLSEKMPGAVIRWNVPFQGGVLADDTQQVTVTSLAWEDINALAHLKELKTVDARQCTDYENLTALREYLPDVEVKYYVSAGGERFYEGSTRMELRDITAEEVALLRYLPKLEEVVLRGNAQGQEYAQLREYCLSSGIDFSIQMGGERIAWDVRSLVVTGATDEELDLIPALPKLKTLLLRNPDAEPEKVFDLQKQYPHVDITWEVEIGGETIPSDAVEVDLSGVEIKDLEQVEKRMEYLPEAEMLILGLCGIDNPNWGNSKSKLAASRIENEDLAAFRDRVRDRYKVAWTVRLGPSIALRTDADNFMPNHFGVGQLPDSYAYNLRYCEDMVCLDVGHMTLTDISFVEYMPKLKYLILAWTEVKYIEPIRTCKNLIFLELDNSCIRDYSPLVDCTALQDLNIGNTFCDITPVLEMTWLENLWMILGDGGKAYKASKALPDTRVVASGTATVGSGWRRLPNYYDMRDCLGMYYMN